MSKLISIFYIVYLIVFLLGCGAQDGKDQADVASSIVSSSSSANGYCQESDLQSGSRFKWVNEDAFTYMENEDTGVTHYEGNGIAFWPDYRPSQSQERFEAQVYSLLRDFGCAECHAQTTRNIAPLIADCDIEIAHNSVISQVNMYLPEMSKIVEVLSVERHHCPGTSCAKNAEELFIAVGKWIGDIEFMRSYYFMSVYEESEISLSQVEEWIREDKLTLDEADKSYMVYVSFHEMYNELKEEWEVPPFDDYFMNVARVALSKALNATARWAPKVVNPLDVSGVGLLYRFDIRDYWGYNQGVERLLFGGADPLNPFGQPQLDYKGNTISASYQNERLNLTGTIVEDAEFATTIWDRILHGNVEGKAIRGTLPSNIKGFHGVIRDNTAGYYVDRRTLEWVEASQLVYTLTRPDVYNAIMINPYKADELEGQLEVESFMGPDSYDYALIKDSAAVDSRMLWRGKRPNNSWYWKTWNVSTGNFSEGGDRNIYDIYRSPFGEDIRYPFWANPIPIFVDPLNVRSSPINFSFVATLGQVFDTEYAEQYGYLTKDEPGCNPAMNVVSQGFGMCRHFTGTGGVQQSESEVIYNLPNGLHGYYLAGAENERTSYAHTNVARDPRRLISGNDDIAYMTGFGYSVAEDTATATLSHRANDPRVIVASSCISCHDAGLKRFRNDLIDGLEGDRSILPTGVYGVDSWIDHPGTVARVRQLYKSSRYWSDVVEEGRRGFLSTMAKIQKEMIIGPDKNTYIEPIHWMVKRAQTKYQYPITTAN